MKVLFINKYDTHGGAAIAGWRLLNALKQGYNAEVKLLCAIKKSDEEFVIPTRSAIFGNFIERGINYIFNQIGLQYYWFPFSSRKILKVAKKFTPDIISLQNIHSGYVATSILPKLSKIAPLVWTLHDMWSFTANAAYTGGNESWKTMNPAPNENHIFPQIGINTGKMLMKRKRDIYKKCNLTIVCPSMWLKELAEQSPLLSGKDILNIPNGVDIKRFKPAADKNTAKSRFHISPEEKVILFYAQNIEDPRKGGQDLLQVLKKIDLPEFDKLTLLTIGGGKFPIELKYIKIKEVGYLSSEEKIIETLQAADVFLFPTHEDNLPNTLVEAIACGIPCITYNVGGCGDIIKDNFNGILVKREDVNHFTEKLKEFLKFDDKKIDEMSKNARYFALENFDSVINAGKYLELFQSLA